MSARLHSASRHTFTRGSFSGKSFRMETSRGITPLWTSCSCCSAATQHGLHEKILNLTSVIRVQTPFEFIHPFSRRRHSGPGPQQTDRCSILQEVDELLIAPHAGS